MRIATKVVVGSNRTVNFTRLGNHIGEGGIELLDQPVALRVVPGGIQLLDS